MMCAVSAVNCAYPTQHTVCVVSCTQSSVCCRQLVDIEKNGQSVIMNSPSKLIVSQCSDHCVCVSLGASKLIVCQCSDHCVCVSLGASVVYSICISVYI